MTAKGWVVGSKQSEDTKRRIAAAHVGRPKSKAHREAIAASRRASLATGGIPSHGTIARYRGARKRPPCHCEECREAWRLYVRERRAATSK